jgi:hypothetical protein
LLLQPLETEPEEMSIVLVLNVVLALLVIGGIVGMLAWSIATQAPVRVARNARGHRRTTTRAQLPARVLEHRA